MLIFAIFYFFGTPKESNQIFRCVKLCIKLKVSYASNIVQKSKKSNEAFLRKLQKTLFLGIFDNSGPSAGESEKCYIQFFCIYQLNIHRLTFMQKIKKNRTTQIGYMHQKCLFLRFLTFSPPHRRATGFLGASSYASN